MSTLPRLKEQFRLMQDQQRDRYLRRRVPSSTSQLKVDSDIQPGYVLKKMPSEDDLGLCTHSETKPPSAEQSTVNVKHPLEVSFLQKEIERLQLQTTELNFAVAHKTREVADMRSKMEEEKEALGGVSSKATQRVVDLSRRNRELTSELAAEKNRVRQLQKELQEAVSKPQVRIDEQNKESPATVQVKEPEDQLTVARLQEELSDAKQKSTDYRNQCQQLKQELKLAHKAVLKEVGEGANLQAALSSTSGWRGRAQQIAALQNKVAELKLQLQLQAPSSTGNGGQAVEPREERGNPEERQKATIRKMEQERKKSLDETRLELQNLRELYNKCQQQNTALKARNKTLTTDAKALRVQVTSLLEKTANDSASIKRLTEGTGQECNGINQSSETPDKSNKVLQAQLDSCLAELKTLRRQTSQFKEDSYTAEMTSRCSTRQKGGPMTSPADGITSLPPIKLPRGTRGIACARKSISAGPHLPWSGDVDTAELQALLRVTEVEKERLLELTTVLQARLDASTDRCAKLDTELRTCRQRTAELEKQVSRQPPPLCKQPSCKGGKPGVVNCSEEHNVGDLRNQLSVQLDENCVLKETLALTRHEKMEDMRMLYSMLQETKHMFTESIKVVRDNTRNQQEN